jgi:hypothetical protein
MKAFDRVEELYHIPLGHRRKQAAYLYSLLTGTSGPSGDSNVAG